MDVFLKMQKYCNHPKNFQKERIIEKLEKCIKEKTERMKEANLFRQKSEEQQAECEVLKEKLAQLEEANDHLQESYEKTIRVSQYFFFFTNFFPISIYNFH